MKGFIVAFHNFPPVHAEEIAYTHPFCPSPEVFIRKEDAELVMKAEHMKSPLTKFLILEVEVSA